MFAGRLLWRLLRIPSRRAVCCFPPSIFRPSSKAWLPRAGLAALLIFPWLALTLTGQAGAIKWIDNFGVQILIYVMLGWGLNIVVGLAGLLDLGYVAFYAVGAYTYALHRHLRDPGDGADVRAVGVLDLPAHRRHARRLLGHLLGFPVLRLRGDYLAIVTLAFGEIIRLVLINWVDLTNGNVGIPTHPQSPSSGCRSTRPANDFADIVRHCRAQPRAPARSFSIT